MSTPNNFPIDVPAVPLTTATLLTDVYAVHVLPLMLDKIKAGKNVPVIAVRRRSDNFGSMMLVRGVIADCPVKLVPVFNDPLPGSTTVVWAEIDGPIKIQYERDKLPRWINIRGRDRTEVLKDIEAESAR